MKTQRQIFQTMQKDGWYIRRDTYECGTNTYAIIKDRISKESNGKYAVYRSCRYYVARDVALLLKKEMGYIIRKTNKQVVALNFNPKENVPQPGHRLSFYE
jgi:hypothetical protein